MQFRLRGDRLCDSLAIATLRRNMNRDTAIQLVLDAARRELERTEEIDEKDRLDRYHKKDDLLSAIDFLCDELYPE